MNIAKWAAVAVTSLMGLANLGLALQQDIALRVVGPVLAVAAAVALFGYLAHKPWGTNAVIGIGAVNLVTAVIGAVAGAEGWAIGLVLSALGIVLPAASRGGSRKKVGA